MNSYGEDIRNYMNDVKTKDCELLEKAEEIELVERIKLGDDEALKELAEKNQRLVISIAKKYQGRGIALNDLIQAGNIGLMKVVKKYDYTKGAAFSTYATYYIRRAIQLTLDSNLSSLYVSNHTVTAYRKYKENEKNLKLILERNPTDAELAKQMGISLKKLKEIKNSVPTTVSIDATIQNEDSDSGSSLQYLLASSTKDTADLVADNELSEVIYKFLRGSGLTEREIKIIELRFGLTGKTPMSLEAVGDIINISRERVRQLEIRALRKMKDPAIKVGLHLYLEDSVDMMMPKQKTKK